MVSAPPMVPGMPRRNSRPAIPASAAARATAASRAAAPARILVSPARSIRPKAAGSRVTTPEMPPSRINRFEPPPITVTDKSAPFVALKACDQRMAVDPFDRRLTRRVDRRNDRRVGAVHACAELFEEMAQPRVTVRLHDRDDGAGKGLARRFQDRRDLHRVMAVIID